MPDKPATMIAPQYKITLTADEALEVGRLSIVWGQIDHFLLQSVTLLLAHDLAAGVALMGDFTTGPLVGQLRKARHRVQDPEIRGAIKQFCEDMGPLITARNHITHGIWGVYLPGKNPNKGKRACLFIKDPKNPLFPEKITEVANKAAMQTYVIVRIWHHLAGFPLPPKDEQPTFFFSPHTPRLKKGMQLIPLAQPPKGHRN